ncbi:family 43 glycosylhydrolase [Duganella dendranthematis]|uniref:Family 43 glycosylhydrolase n=1 Tax=Duganella dendranthematis TaxID=2728021 RepID=A0ABX6M7G7_9BURK|nr:family 43 glycosylhydrolase [Duganella dendranthematis]QJD90254.1 family 43 glycosylhydrolase [Duganella dendranthematis]
MTASRRTALKTLLAGAAVAPQLATAAAEPTWGRGVEGQRKADLGNGTFLNPILAGDHPDPTILKDGDDYYMTFSSFLAYPGVIIWHSQDLVNWQPIGPALTQPLGSIWAMDLVKHNGRYFIYIPAGSSIYVIWADNIKGPWSDPIDLKIEGAIDPGHAVGEDGKRYLFVNGVRRIGLTDDGLATIGKLEKVYEPWRYQQDWVVEMFAPEGPKLLRRGEWFYLVMAVGGTSGPPTSHMVIAARSRSIHGPWENHPSNPLVRTRSAEEKWWSRGHASLVEGPAGDWWLVYHGYENGYRTLGRQCLLEPIEWTRDGWFKAKGGDLSKPLPTPKKGKAVPHNFAKSDDFQTTRFGVQWSFFNPGPDEMKRVQHTPGTLAIQGKGTSPVDASPLTFIAGDRAYEATITMEIGADAEGGLLLHYSERAYVGIGFTPTQMKTFAHSQEQSWMREKMDVSTVHIRMRNDRHIVTFHYSLDGKQWVQHPWQMEVSGLHHNVFGGFASLQPGIYSAGTGVVKLRDFKYRALA